MLGDVGADGSEGGGHDDAARRFFLIKRLLSFDEERRGGSGRGREEEKKHGKKETHVTVLALVAALKTFSAPCTAGSMRSSRSRPFSGFMMTGLAVWMSAVQPLRASSNEEGSVRSAFFFVEEVEREREKREEEEVPRESSKGASKIAWGKIPHPLLSFLSLSHIHFSHLEQLQLLLRPGQRPQMRVLGGVGGVADRAPDRMAGREEASDDGRRQVARRSRDADVVFFVVLSTSERGLRSSRGHGAERKSNDASETKRERERKMKETKRKENEKDEAVKTKRISLSLSLSPSLF